MGGYEKKFTVAALALTTLLSGEARSRTEAEILYACRSATVRPTEGGWYAGAFKRVLM